MILSTLAASTKKRVNAAKKAVPLEAMMSLASKACRCDGGESRFPFEKALRATGMSFICEVKRASPSKGLIAPDFPYVDIAREYEAAGACAVSVLTEPDYFLGSNDYLVEIHKQVSLPLLRKDFTIDPYQIFEAKALGASAILLICTLLDTEALRTGIELCEDLGMNALVEAHNEAEIKSALQAGAGIIGVNNRDLKTFEVDFSNSIRLRRLVPDSVLFVAESGIQSTEDIRRLHNAGVDAILIGETLMRSPNKKDILDSWKLACNEIEAETRMAALEENAELEMAELEGNAELGTAELEGNVELGMTELEGNVELGMAALERISGTEAEAAHGLQRHSGTDKGEL